jgi:hypothetical protein
LIDDREVLLDITSLGHGNDSTILKVKNTVLLEDRTEHGLDDNTWTWVGDERGLFMQLLGEEIDTQVSVLASGSGGGNSDDLARTTLKDQEIAKADVVAWNGDSVWGIGWLGGGTRTLGAWTSIFIIVTHLCFRETGRIYGLLRDADFFTNGVCWVTRSVGSLFSEVNSFSDRLVDGRRVNGLAGDTNFFAVCRLRTRRVDGSSADTNFFTVTWLELRGVYSSTTDSDFLTVAWLDTGSIFTFGDVNLSACVLSAFVMRSFDVNVVGSLVFSTTIGNFEVDMGRCLILLWLLGCGGRSSLVTDVDIFSAARTVVMFLFTADMNYLLSGLVSLVWWRWKVGRERGELTVPSDARWALGKLDLTLDVSLGGGFLLIVAPVRRWKNAEGDRDAGVKVQIDDLFWRELFSNAFRRAERKTRRGLLLLLKEGEGRERSVGSLLDSRVFQEDRKEGGVKRGIEVVKLWE